MKTNEEGEEEWHLTFGDELRDSFSSIIQTEDGGYVLGGSVNVEPGINTNSDFVLVRTDSEGEILWTRTYGGREDEDFEDMLQTPDGGFILAGRTQSFGAGSYDFYLIRTNETGDELWSTTYGGRQNEECKSIIHTSDGGFALAGFSSSYNEDGRNLDDFWLVKTGPEPLMWLSFTDSSFFEDDWLIFDLDFLLEHIIPVDLRDSVLVFSTEGEYVHGEFEDEILTITSDLNWFGEDSLRLVVSEDGDDEVNRDTTYLNLTVQPMNDLPERFALLNPPDEAVIGSWIATFSWEQAEQNEREEDLVRYNLHFRAGENESGYWERLDTTYEDLSMVQLANRLSIELGQSDIEVEWWINALDDSGLTECDNHFTFTIPIEYVPQGDTGTVPDVFSLGPIYPNPFNSRTNIRYQLPLSVNVVLTIFDVNGREVAELINKKLDAGFHNVEWRASDTPAGIYFCRMEAGTFFHICKIILIM